MTKSFGMQKNGVGTKNNTVNTVSYMGYCQARKMVQARIGPGDS